MTPDQLQDQLKDPSLHPGIIQFLNRQTRGGFVKFRIPLRDQLLKLDPFLVLNFAERTIASTQGAPIKDQTNPKSRMRQLAFEMTHDAMLRISSPRDDINTEDMEDGRNSNDQVPSISIPAVETMMIGECSGTLYFRKSPRMMTPRIA